MRKFKNANRKSQRVAGSKKKKVVVPKIQVHNKQTAIERISNARKWIIPIHICRYDRRIKRLMATTEISEDEVDGETITWKMFFNARNKKIAAYRDAVKTMIQKEELLQYHNRDLIVEMNTEETITIGDVRPKIDVSKLTLEEQIELYHLMQKAKIRENFPVGVSQTDKGHDQAVVDIEHEEIGRPNVETIKHEERILPLAEAKTLQADPLIKLKEALAKVAAREFKKVGGTMDTEEEELIK